jgi:hypothetical protein
VLSFSPCNTEINNTYYVGYVCSVLIACMKEMINAYKILVGEFQVNRPLGRPSLRWKDNIRMNVRNIGCERVSRLNWFRTGPNGELL